ncbi:MAG: radical SAM family heme chaperone HemW [Chloroflexi bacterium]|nr:radical SAM family heme chaperone HemW [Chloroflexota bacterium]
MPSLYVHIPFCRHRCGYCDFNTYSGLDSIIPRYVEALAKEIREVGTQGDAPSLHTLFFGGGTPSLLTAGQAGVLMQAIRHSFSIEADAEITLEANPGGLTEGYLSELLVLGLNRISLGVQSIHPAELAVLEREHGIEQVVSSVRAARAAGFANLSLDLIYGIPGQTLDTWEESLTRVLALEPDHLSLYALTLEHGTPLRREVRSGRVPAPDDDLAAEMYEQAGERLARNGFAQYEISNWARRMAGPDAWRFASRHNLQYWRNLPYFGVGAGAHGYVNGRRYSNVLAPATYIRRMDSGASRGWPLSRAAARSEILSNDEAMRQSMWLGLRLTEEGVPVGGFQHRFGVSPDERFGREIDELLAHRLIERQAKPDRLRLTEHGRLLANQVFVRFV